MYCSQVVPLALAHADITAVTATVTTIIFSLSMRMKMKMRFRIVLIVLNCLASITKCQPIFIHTSKNTVVACVKSNDHRPFTKMSIIHIQHNPAVKRIQSLVSTDQYSKHGTYKIQIPKLHNYVVLTVTVCYGKVIVKIGVQCICLWMVVVIYFPQVIAPSPIKKTHSRLMI